MKKSDKNKKGFIFIERAEKEKKCPDCGKMFKYKPHNNPRYQRKYCDACSKERKKAWDERYLMKIEDGVD